MPPCHICQSSGVETLLDFGPQALSNRYLSSPEESEPLFPFVLGQCADCGLIQIPDSISPSELKPRFDWITYNEQEGHLDDLVEKICQLPGVTTEAVIGAISFKDDTTLARFQKCGFGKTWRLDPGRDLRLTDRLAGLETIQAELSSENAERIVEQRGLTDVLIVRHILEHTHDPRRFLAALRKLIKPGGCIVFEVPDCAPALERGDYTMFWEEHVLYFTPEAFQRSFAVWEFAPVHFKRYVYANENSLVAIVQPASTGKSISSEVVPASSLRKLGKRYAGAFPEYREKIADALAQYRLEYGKIAVFGAGHLSCAWINFLGVGQHIEFVVDDHPRKIGLFMPGSRLPIRASTDLRDQNVKLCLLSLSPESEIKVIQKNQAFVEKGGRFASIFPGKPNSFVTR
jgi:hypothetical protein